MEKKITTISIEIYDLDYDPIDKLIEKLTNAKQHALEQGLTDIKFYVEKNWSDDYPSINYYLKGKRLETDEDLKIRTAKELEQQEVRKAAYERLKKEFESK